MDSVASKKKEEGPGKVVAHWKGFFERCGIPSNVSLKYAKTFFDNRVQPNMLEDLDKDLLKELGITAVGDVIAILKRAKYENAEQKERETLESFESDQPAKPKILKQIKKQAPLSQPEAEIPKPKPVLKRPAVKLSKPSNEPVPKEVSESPSDRISPSEDEGSSLKVKMPEGTTLKSQLLLKRAALLQAKREKQAAVGKASTSTTTTVFQRLGALAGSEPPAPKRKAVTFALTAPTREDSPEVSSTTGDDDEDEEFTQIGTGSLRSDSSTQQSALQRLGGGLKVKPTLGTSHKAESTRSNISVTLSSGSGVPPRMVNRLGAKSTSALPDISAARLAARAQRSIDSSGGRITINTGQSLARSNSAPGIAEVRKGPISPSSTLNDIITEMKFTVPKPESRSGNLRDRLGELPLSSKPQSLNTNTGVFSRLG